MFGALAIVFVSKLAGIFGSLQSRATAGHAAPSVVALIVFATV